METVLMNAGCDATRRTEAAFLSSESAASEAAAAPRASRVYAVGIDAPVWFGDAVR